MPLRTPTLLLAIAMLLTAGAGAARAQVTSLADDILLITKGVSNQEQQRSDEHLGTAAGGESSALGPAPGSGQPRSDSRGGMPTTRRGSGGDVLRAAEGEAQYRPPEMQRPRPQQTRRAPAPQFLGALALPAGEDPGPENGLTLDAAIDLLMRQNYSLRVKSHEIPIARADTLTASLRANPMVFGTVGSIPYRPYSPARPGELNYSATVIYPFDISQKRLARTEVATRAGKVVEAQYQDAVRMELDHLYAAFVEVVAARETLRYARANRDGLQQVARLAQTQLQNREIAAPDLDRISIQLDSAEIGVEQASLAYIEARHQLGLLLALPTEESERIELRGSMRDPVETIPSEEQLRATALGCRPDLAAYRLGIGRAQADVQLAHAEKTSDLFLLYSPWELRNNTPVGGQNATSWSLAAFGSVPLFNRNQGNIRRAEINVAQTRVELAALEQQILDEVHGAYHEYEASRDVVRRLEQTVLPRSQRIRDASARLLSFGETSAVDYLAAQREYNDVVRQYRDALIRHRRSMLRMNTVVAQRVLP